MYCVVLETATLSKINLLWLRRRSDAGVEECKGYSPPNDHTTSASSTPLPLGSWNLNTGTRSTESERFRSARMARNRARYAQRTERQCLHDAHQKRMFPCISKRRICPRRCVAASSATRIVSRRRQIVASTSSNILTKSRSLTVLFKYQIKNPVLAFT